MKAQIFDKFFKSFLIKKVMNFINQIKLQSPDCSCLPKQKQKKTPPNENRFIIFRFMFYELSQIKRNDIKSHKN